MNKKLLSCLLVLLAVTSAGCSLAPYRQPTSDTTLHPGSPLPDTPRPIQQQNKAVIDSLYQQYREWKGTRYALGGMSKRGIDCSGLVYITYRDHLGIELPRTTRYQAQVGNAVKRQQLRPGDLVFFKTGRKLRHVGIYIDNDRFFHASTSRGVTISEMSNRYWKNRYRHARRLELSMEGSPPGK